VESLINKKIILYQSYGSHKLNPVYYFYGTEDERKKCLEELKHEVEPLMVAEKESQYSKPITDFDTVSSKK
jgi:uncharacterized protein (DUF2164 family)